jgi:hypothetical protein|tara:strand:+ start:271 stop:456 length:186 start_codon:yes stop_codon:yes gene_type:complete
MVSFTDMVEAFNMLKESKNSGLTPLEATVMISYVLKDLLIVAAILRVIVWFKQVKEGGDDV